MPPKRKSKSKHGKSKRQRTELGPSVMSYKGPIVPPAARGELDVHTQTVSFTGLLTSDGSGFIATYLVNGISAATDWAGLAALYKEYRVLGVKVDYMPHNRYSKVTTACTPFAIAIDHSGSTSAPVSYDEVIQYSSGTKKSSEDPWTMTARMSGAEEAQFRPITTVTPIFGFKLFASNLTATTTYGRYFYYWLVQFRGRY
jgi:hypothetical protein